MTDRLRPAVAGLLAALTALALSELVAGLVAAVPSLVESVGGVVIDNVPPGVKDWAISTFGTADKPVLIFGIVITVAGLGALTGVLARGRFWVAAIVFVGFGLLGALAAKLDGRSEERRVGKEDGERWRRG